MEQYLSLDNHASTELNRRLRHLAQHPRTLAAYDRKTDRWSVDFDAARGLVVFVLNDEHLRIIILRVLHLG